MERLSFQSTTTPGGRAAVIGSWLICDGVNQGDSTQEELL